MEENKIEIEEEYNEDRPKGFKVKKTKTKKKKPLWAKLILRLFSALLSLVVLAAFLWGFIFIKYQINIIDTVKQVKVLNEQVDLNLLAPNAHSNSDLADAKVSTDMVLPEFIGYDETTKSYKVPGQVSSMPSGDIKLTDKQVGAVLNNILDSQEKIEVQIGSKIDLKEYGFKIVQVQFSNIENNSTDFNIVLKVELEKVKEKMTKFPLNWISKIVPNDLYLSATVRVIHDNTQDFVYTTEAKSLTINNLTKKQTDDIFTLANTFMKIGTAKEFGKTIADAFVNVLIGSETTTGLAYSLKSNGVAQMASDFAFETLDGLNYFVIKK